MTGISWRDLSVTIRIRKQRVFAPVFCDCEFREALLARGQADSPNSDPGLQNRKKSERSPRNSLDRAQQSWVELETENVGLRDCVDAGCN